MRVPSPSPSRNDRGITLIEVMIAIVVLSVGVLAVGQLFPAGSRSQVNARMTTTASYLAQEQLEELECVAFTDPSLSAGRHPVSGTAPAGTNGQYGRSYEVTTMSAPLANLKRVTVTVEWAGGRRSVSTTTYVRR
jgi:prepilin-type N-terminal cleavage/methylation domain-containing protein